MSPRTGSSARPPAAPPAARPDAAPRAAAPGASSSAPIEAALREMLRKKDFASFAADLRLPGAAGTVRRIEVRGDGLVLVTSNGAPASAPAPRSIGEWRGGAEAALVAQVAQACLDMRPDELPPGGDALLVVQAGDRTAEGGIGARRAGSLVAAFEEAARGAKATATVSLQLAVRREGAALAGEIRFVADGAEPVVVPHPAAAAADGTLVLWRADQPVELRCEAGPDRVVLQPGEHVAATFTAALPPGEGPVEARWTVPSPPFAGRFGAFSAPAGMLASAPSEI